MKIRFSKIIKQKGKKHSPYIYEGVTRHSTKNGKEIRIYLGSIANQSTSANDFKKNLTNTIKHEAFHYYTPTRFMSELHTNKRRLKKHEKMALDFGGW